MSTPTVDEIDLVISWYDAEISRLKSAIDKRYWTFTRCARGAWPTSSQWPEIKEKFTRETERRILWAIRRKIMETTTNV